VLSKIYEPKGDEVTGEWRRLRNEELYALYSSPNIIRVAKLRRLKWAEHVARMGERRGVYRFLMGKSEGRRLVGRPRCSWESTINIIFEKWDRSIDWFDLGMDTHKCRTVVNGVTNLRVSQNAENFSTIWEHIGFSRGCLLHGVNYIYNRCLN
jgi:hypothetical protein